PRRGPRPRTVPRGAVNHAGEGSGEGAEYDPPVQQATLTELDSGERRVTERLDHVRSVALGFWIGAGSRDEADPKAGITHLIEHLLFKGTDSYTAQEIAETFDALGGELHAATSREHTVVCARVPDERLQSARRHMGGIST